MKTLMMIGALLCAALASQSKAADKPASLEPIYQLTLPAVAVQSHSLDAVYKLCNELNCPCPEGTCDCIDCKHCPCDAKRGYVREDKPDLRASLERVTARLEALETKPREVVKPDVKPEIRRGYPVHGRVWHRRNGIPESDAELLQHLQTGEHAGKFPVDWLRTLTREEKEALHADAHDNRVQWQYVPGHSTSRSAAKPMSASADEVLLEFNGKLARYSMQVETVRQQECRNGVCSFKDVQRVKPVFLGWK